MDQFLPAGVQQLIDIGMGSTALVLVIMTRLDVKSIKRRLGIVERRSRKAGRNGTPPSGLVIRPPTDPGMVR